MLSGEAHLPTDFARYSRSNRPPFLAMYSTNSAPSLILPAVSVTVSTTESTTSKNPIAPRFSQQTADILPSPQHRAMHDCWASYVRSAEPGMSDMPNRCPSAHCLVDNCAFAVRAQSSARISSSPPSSPSTAMVAITAGSLFWSAGTYGEELSIPVDRGVSGDLRSGVLTAV